MQEYTWKIFFENAIEMVSITSLNREREAQTYRNHHHFACSSLYNSTETTAVGLRTGIMH